MVASLLGLVAVVLCVTLILLPLGIPLLKVSRQLFTKAVRLMLPPTLAHPVKEAGRAGRRASQKARARASDNAAKVGGRGRRAGMSLPAKVTKSKKRRRLPPGKR
jgi:hypothetical protein